MAASAGDVIRVVAKMSWGENDIQNVYHFQIAGASIPDNDDLIDDIALEMDNLYQIIDLNIPDEVTFDTVEAYNVSEGEWIGEEDWPTLTAGGGVGSDPLPPQIAPLVLFNTGELKSQGRKFLPPHTEATNDTDGTPVSGLLTTLATYAASLIGGASGTGWTGTYGNYQPLVDVFVEWLSAEVRDIWATQRRRYFGRGA